MSIDNEPARHVINGSGNGQTDMIVMTPYPVGPSHTLMTIVRLAANQWRPELKTNASYIAEGPDAGIVINKSASIMDYNRTRAAQNDGAKRPIESISFQVSMIHSDTNVSSLEQRTLRFWIAEKAQTASHGVNPENSIISSHAHFKHLSSQLAQSYFCELLGTKPDDDFPKDYLKFIIKVMRLLKKQKFNSISNMELEVRPLSQDEITSNPSAPRLDDQEASTLDKYTVGNSSQSNSGRRSPITSQKILDIIESSYPNPISVRGICSTLQSDEQQVRRILDELVIKEKISPTGKDQQMYTRITIATHDTKIQMVKQMPDVVKSKQPVIAIITSQYCEKLAVDTMISDKETFVRYRTTYSSGSTASDNANYVYTLGNIGDHRVVSTKLTSIGHSREALIGAGSATTRLLGTFPEIEYVFLVGCAGGVPNYSDFASHVRLGDIVISHLPSSSDLTSDDRDADIGMTVQRSKSVNQTDYVYAHCQARSNTTTTSNERGTSTRSIPMSVSIHNNLKRLPNSNGDTAGSSSSSSSSLSSTSQIKDPRWFEQQQQSASSSTPIDPNSKILDFEDCHFRLWRPARLDLQELSVRLWTQGLVQQTSRIWEYYIDQGIELLAKQDIDAARPPSSQDKLFISIGANDTIEVNHPEPSEDEVDLRTQGRPMCHFGPLGSGQPAASNETLKQRMINDFGLKAFDLQFYPVIESIDGNRKESYIMIRGISDYHDGRKRKDWQQYSALVAASFMKSLIVNLEPI